MALRDCILLFRFDIKALSGYNALIKIFVAFFYCSWWRSKFAKSLLIGRFILSKNMVLPIITL